MGSKCQNYENIFSTPVTTLLSAPASKWVGVCLNKKAANELITGG